jgi:hypothetical protein
MPSKSFNENLVEIFEALTNDEISKILDDVEKRLVSIKVYEIDYKKITGYDPNVVSDIRDHVIKKKRLSFKQYKVLGGFLYRSEKILQELNQEVLSTVNDLLGELNIKQIQ